MSVRNMVTAPTEMLTENVLANGSELLSEI